MKVKHIVYVRTPERIQFQKHLIGSDFFFRRKDGYGSYISLV